MFSLESDKMTVLWPNDSSNSIPNWTTFVKWIILIWWLVHKVTKLLLCDQITAILSLFMSHSEIAYTLEQYLSKKIFNSMLSLESSNMTLNPNYSLNFTNHVRISIHLIVKSPRLCHSVFLSVIPLKFFSTA